MPSRQQLRWLKNGQEEEGTSLIQVNWILLLTAGTVMILQVGKKWHGGHWYSGLEGYKLGARRRLGCPGCWAKSTSRSCKKCGIHFCEACFPEGGHVCYMCWAVPAEPRELESRSQFTPSGNRVSEVGDSGGGMRNFMEDDDMNTTLHQEEDVDRKSVV